MAILNDVLVAVEAKKQRCMDKSYRQKVIRAAPSACSITSSVLVQHEKTTHFSSAGSWLRQSTSTRILLGTLLGAGRASCTPLPESDERERGYELLSPPDLRPHVLHSLRSSVAFSSPKLGESDRLHCISSSRSVPQRKQTVSAANSKSSSSSSDQI